MRSRGTAARRRNVVVATDFATFSGREFFAGVLRYMQAKANWNIHVIQSKTEITADAIVRLSHKGIDGIITSEIGDDAAQRVLENLQIPLVVAGTRERPLPGRTHATAFVTIDEESIGRYGAEFLLRLGKFASYAFVPTAETFNRNMSELRFRGFRMALGQEGIRPLHFTGPNLAEWLNEIPKPAALFVSHDQRAVDVLDCCRTTKIAIPRQVSILSVDNDELICSSTFPQLSSLLIESEKEGYAAAAELNRFLSGRRPSTARRQIKIKGAIRPVERDSTRPVAPAIHLLTKADEFIAQNVTRDIGVDDVVAHLKVSRRLAELRFRQYRGKSIIATITDARLTEFARRLLKSKLPIRSISTACGFTDPRYLKRLFKRRFGVTPHDYRDLQQQLPGVRRTARSCRSCPPRSDA